MDNSKYNLRYLPSFYEDLESGVRYIAETLQNPRAADELVGAIEKAIIERLPNAEIFEKYHSVRDRKYPYYRIYVKNYVVYYVVINDVGEDKIMEVRRLLHNKRNIAIVI